LNILFNGGALKLENNISQLYDNCIFKIKIYHNNEGNLTCNNKILEKNSDNTYVYIGKLINNQLILENNNLNCIFSFEYEMENLNFKDNTNLITF